MMDEKDPILGTDPQQHCKAGSRTFRSNFRRHFCVKSRAAILVLCWNFCITLIFTSILDPIVLLIAETTSIDQDTFTHAVGVLVPSFCACTAFLYLFYPLAGYLADTKCGRYKTIICSLCSFTMLYLVAIIIVTVVTTSLHMQNSLSYVFFTFLLPPFPSYIVFSANVIQFGMDQLYDSPMEDSVLFIHWFVLTSYLATVLFKALALLVVQSGIVLGIFGLLTLVVTLCIAWCRKKWFLANSGIQRNPYKLIVKVTNFAKRHNAPVCRSAFTYCEDELPSRLDLGKEKYGGPFSTEEVEDVKAFVGIIYLLMTFWSVFTTDIARNGLIYGLSYHLDDCWYSNIFKDCRGENVTLSDHFSVFKNYVQATLRTGILTDLLIVVFILLYIYFLRPLVYRTTSCCSRYCRSIMAAGMLHRIGFGMIFLSISLLSTLIIDVIKHEIQPSETCLLRSTPHSNLEPDMSSHYFISEWYLVIPFTFNALGYTLFYTATYEFICAQSPHAMKGLIVGTFFAIKGIFQLIGALIVLPFSILYKTLRPSCASVYYLVTILISLLGLMVYAFVARRYKYRQRDEPDNIYRYAEDYYSKAQDEEQYDDSVSYYGSYNDPQTDKAKLN